MANNEPNVFIINIRPENWEECIKDIALVSVLTLVALNSVKEIFFLLDALVKIMG